MRTITTGAEDLRSSDALTPAQVAGYLAKYATKDATTDGVSTRPHALRLRWWCEQLAELAHEREEWRRAGWDTVVPVDPKTGRDHYGLLGKWAHMLGFRGHFSSKSRRYALTLGRLRRARARFQRLMAQAEREGTTLDTADLEARLLADDADEETTLVVGDWRYTGTGWPRSGDELLAQAAAARAREYDQWRAQQRRQTNEMRGM
ncbi:replication initiator [Kocuria marina]|uniref:replication initiator n=1 Tax=Kocuria marina TaxID=223184 RepID=UPI0038109285